MIDTKAGGVLPNDDADYDADIATLSDKEKLFCANYVHNGMNIYQAAVSAGYSESYAKSSSYKLMENVGIKKFISRLLREIEFKMINELIASKQELMKFWTDVMRGKLHNPHAVPEKAFEKMEQLSFIDMANGESGEVFVPDEIKIPLSQRMKASEYLAKHFEMFADVLQKNITNQNVIVHDDVANMSDEELRRLAKQLVGGDNG